MAKKNRPYHLTSAEESVMNTLWNSKEPMALFQIVEEAQKNSDVSWKPRSLFSIANGLLEKGLIKENGLVRAGKTHARTFVATTSRAVFYANMVKYLLSDEEIVELRNALEVR